jgi:hypothetical protein
MRGRIWEGFDARSSGLAAVVEDAMENGVPMILERNGPLGKTSDLLSDCRILAEIAGTA